MLILSLALVCIAALVFAWHSAPSMVEEIEPDSDWLWPARDPQFAYDEWRRNEGRHEAREMLSEWRG